MGEGGEKCGEHAASQDEFGSRRDMHCICFAEGFGDRIFGTKRWRGRERRREVKTAGLWEASGGPWNEGVLVSCDSGERLRYGSVLRFWEGRTQSRMMVPLYLKLVIGHIVYLAGVSSWIEVSPPMRRTIQRNHCR